MQKNKIAIWIPAKNKQGLGHYYRNKWIVEQSKIAHFFCSEKVEYNLTESVEEFISNDGKLIEDFLIDHGYSTLFIDNYFLAESLVSYFLNNRRIRVVWFDQNFSGPRFSALINSNPFARQDLYSDSDIKNTQLFLGVEYFGFRKEFYNIQREVQTEKSIFVALGGSDVKKITLALLDVLPEGFQYTICLGKGCSQNYVEEVSEKFQKLELRGAVYCDPENYLTLLANSSAAILTSSTSVYEAEFFQIPYVVFNVVDNQNRLADYLNKNGITVLQTVNDLKISQDFSEFKKLNMEFGNKCKEFLNYLESV